MNRTSMMPDVLTLDEVASYLRLPKETVERQAQHGQLPGKKIEDSWRFLKAAIDDWLRSQTTPDRKRGIQPQRNKREKIKNFASLRVLRG